MSEQKTRTLSDEDVEAIAAALLEKVEQKVYYDMGKGIWGIVSKVLLALVLGLAAYGAVTGGKFTWPSGTH